METLRRHRLARLSSEGWQGVLARPWDAQAHECLAHWARHGLPLVVTRQTADAGDCELIALGLPAPGRWARRRLAVHVPPASVSRFEEFPELAEVVDLLPLSERTAGDLQAGLASSGATAHVYGSYGWQALSGLDHVRPGSDLDLWVAVRSRAHADDVARHLDRFASSRLRLDGELMFADGTAVAWREWSDWRAGRARGVMVKRLTGAALRYDADWCEGARDAALAT
ncbi:malonate decarboxylase holo-[acyl-carrier-protein] synthase [Variovorax sp. dw_308]|uniref:malonate decarboxylase holo-[acyl-carrier-protein] synthase n=1 Tax=Variovorax sp. dw_308 TaxID=2721546 RepID=UPI001C485E3C|nr:malonate decarboxylase holo-[acyl-carrier-protein] synthase [Variovorax sp. dw_308]